MWSTNSTFVPPPPPPPSKPVVSNKVSWRAKQQEKDRQEREEKQQLEKENSHYWEPSSKNTKWTTIHELQEVIFRVSCLLNAGIEPDQILVSFDFDGTLGARRSSSTHHLERLHEKSRKDMFNEEMKSVRVLEKLNKLNIPYFVNTAAQRPCRARDSMKNHDFQDNIGIRPTMPISEVLINRGMEDVMHEKKEHYKGMHIKTCGHVMSAEYDKHVPIDYVIHRYNLPTKIILHVDDGIINLRTIMERGFSQLVIGLYFPTVPGTIVGSEPDQDVGLEYLHNHSDRFCNESCGY